MALINKSRLLQYLKLNYNVLFIGEHGVGKTAIIKEVFEESGLRWKYFSCSTLDPWVDFVGIPKVVELQGKSVMQLIRPVFIENDEVDALYLDELNRAPDKVINAIMELIQFKSINGHKLNNLRVIWAAINPEDEADTYSVNHLDPAHLDRFHVHMKVPYKLDDEYFKKKFPDYADIFIDWWGELPVDIKKMVSPRRLEYSIHAFMNGCRIEDFIPPESNPKKLRDSLQNVPFAKGLSMVTDQASAETFLRDPNNSIKLLELIKVGNVNSIDFFKKYAQNLPKELIEPYIEAIAAKKLGVTVVNSLKELIEKLPGGAMDKGNSGTAAIINEADLVGMCARRSTTLDAECGSLANNEVNVLKKLANRMVDIVFTCKTETLVRIFWGQRGRDGGSATNFSKLLAIIGKLNKTYSLLSGQQVSVINEKLYDKKIVETRTFLV